MSFTYNIALGDDISKVRMLVPDRNAAAYFFEDAEITALLAMESGDVRCGAALALETMASDEAYVQKVIKLLELATNGAQTAKALMDRAARLREQTLAAALATEDEFGWAEMVVDDFSYRERVEAEALRDA